MAAADTQNLRYRVPQSGLSAPHCAQITVRKSRFLAQACRCRSRGDCLEFVDRIRQLHPDATHHCWAFVAGPPGDSALVGSSDDGEPRGTAGRPILNALLHCGIGQICVVVSRWFGGIKLGTGGLARAYQDAVAENLKTLPLASAVPRSRCLISSVYASMPDIRRILPEYEAEIEKEEYAADAALTLLVPLDQCSLLKQAVARLSNGKASFVEEIDISK